MLENRVLSLSYGRIIIKPPEKLHGLVPESFETYQIVDPGDIIIRSTDLQNDWTSLRVGIVRDRGIITSAYLCLKAKGELDPEYAFQLLHAFDIMKVFYGLGSGLRQNLSFVDFKRLPLFVPPQEEQTAIVRYIDYVDRRIRRYIRAKQEQIKLLDEQRQAIIHQSVTRGLDPNVRLKPSGIEWLGDVPENWEVVRFGRLIRLTTGFPFKSDGFSQLQGDIRLLRGINIAPGRVRWDAVVRWPRADLDAFPDFEMKPGDIVLGMDRPIISGGVRVAAITELDVPSLLLQRVARIRPFEELNPKFALLLLSGKSFVDYLAPIFTGISVPHVSPEQIGAFRIAMPSEEEQATIVAWVTDSTAAINTAIDRANREIFLLREYHARMIADLVTGKLDVRETASGLPDENSQEDALLEEMEPIAEYGLEEDDSSLEAELEEVDV
jgi:type I restriction enzyme S subunit